MMKAKVQLYGMGDQELKYPILYDLFTISLPLKILVVLVYFYTTGAGTENYSLHSLQSEVRSLMGFWLIAA
jgi:hypothetical protein